MLPPDLPIWLQYIESMAVHDYHNNKVFNGWLEGTAEHETYANKINELKELKGEL